MQESVNNNNIKLIKTLGEIIKEHREVKNKTIYGISAESSMSKSTWREVELGVCNDINLTTLWKIAEGLEITPASLLTELRERLGNEFSLTGLD